MDVATYLCQYIAVHNVHHIFGYPGATIIPFLEAIQRHPSLEWILMRHEGSAALAASAYGKTTNDLSVCTATSGPGVTNLLTGVLDAALDRVPMLVITGMIPTWKQNLNQFQDVDQIQILKPYCYFSAAALNPLQVPPLLQTAIGYAIKFKCVAHLAIAVDVQSMRFSNKEYILAKKYLKKKHQTYELLNPPQVAVDIIAKTINQFKNILIVVGKRARGAGIAIEKLSEKLNAPIIATFSGKGVVNESHSNYFGVLGIYGAPANPIAMKVIEKTELVLAFGVDDLFYFISDKQNFNKRAVIQCEPDITCINPQFVQTRFILGNLTFIAEQLAKIKFKYLNKFLPHNRVIKKILPVHKNIISKQFVHPHIFFNSLNTYTDKRNTLLAFDIGDSTLWAVEKLILSQYQTTLVSNRLGTMGFCLPALIAAKLAKPSAHVIGICGDGGLQMCLAELNSAVQLQLNIFIIVFNNGVLQRVNAQQKNSFGVHIKNPSFTHYAACCDAHGFLIKNDAEIDSQLKQAFLIKKGPVLIEVKCDPKLFATMKI